MLVGPHNRREGRWQREAAAERPPSYLGTMIFSSTLSTSEKIN
jgi:hypothetical protein